MRYEREIRERHSVRKYSDDRIDGEVLEKLNRKIGELNDSSGLKIQLMLDEPSAFSNLLTRMTFKNARNYFAMIGPESDDVYEKIGYHGEDLVLYAQSLGLNTCWAMMCSKKALKKKLDDGDVYPIGISVGYGAEQGEPHKNRPVSEVADIEDAPDWFVKGVESAMLAPTGMNAQRFRFERDGNKVSLTGGNGVLKRIDLGIVKFHFECGAGKENFVWKM